MNRLAHKTHKFTMRRNRVRSTVSGTTKRPRLCIYVSNQNITAQVIDDTKHSTLAYATSIGQKDAPKNMTQRAQWVGTEIAKSAKTAKVKTVVFDRSGRLYHGRIKALAEAARQAGLEF